MNFLQRLIDQRAGAGPGEEQLHNYHYGLVRIAVYDSLRAAPRIVDLCGEDYGELINLLSTKTYQFSQEKGGSIPFSVIKEIIENLIHAFFKEVIISIFEDGNMIRISDQGPGIIDVGRAVQPGFSTATTETKRFIKGVGSGLPIVKETMSFIGGDVEIDSNLKEGTVVTLKLSNRVASRDNAASTLSEPLSQPGFRVEPGLISLFTDRQKRVMSLIIEYTSVGPSKIAEELDISLSTAHRDLTILEEYDLIKSDERGRRSLTSKGIDFMMTYFG